MLDREVALAHATVLSGFSEVGIKILASVARERVFTNGQALQTQGEVPRELGVLFLASGRVRCEVRNGEGAVLALGNLGPGDHVGGLRLFGESPSPITVVAEGEVGALLIDRAAFERLQRQKPQTALKLLMALANDFGARLGENASTFGEYAVFAATRANFDERGHFASYAELGLEPTPSYTTLPGVRLNK